MIERLTSGLWSMRVPMPDNPLGYTLVYVLESDRGPVLVDTGWDADVGWEALTEGLVAAGSSVHEVYGVLATHHHTDHAGLVGRVREASGAWVAMHEADTRILHHTAAAMNPDVDSDEAHRWRSDPRGTGMLVAAGAGDEVIARVESAGHTRFRPPALPDRDLADGELVDVPGRRVRAIWTPGHTPGHMCFYLEDANRLLSGDHVLPVITPHVPLFPIRDRKDADPLGDYLASLSRVGDMATVEVLPAHEHRFEGLEDRTKEIIEHHQERLRQVLDDLDKGPRTLWQIAQGMQWNTAWDVMSPFMWRMAVGEAAAHVRHLESHGRVVAVPADGVLRFAKEDGASVAR
ncbi:MAG: MBL fold metallo-hydrolase [Streptosporangiales bacterium]